MPIIPVFRKQKQGDGTFQATLSYSVKYFSIITKERKPGVMVSSYNHSPSGRLRQEDHWEFEVCLGYKVSKDKGPGM